MLPLWFEITSLVVFFLIIVLDLLLVVARPRKPSMREAALWVAGYSVLALIFAASLLFSTNLDYTGKFLAGWITEYSLSLDNLFVFVLIIGSRFAVPEKYQQRVIMVGIIIAIVFRAIFILLGAALLNLFSWIFFIFGVILIWAAYKQVFSSGHAQGKEGRFMRWLRNRLRISDVYDGGKLRTGVRGNRSWTPMILVFLTVGITDVIFALDSIPAIFGITSDPFLVFAANLFALMGLRQLYFLLSGCLDRLEYLKYGIAFVLGFIGIKLILHALHENHLPFINGGKPIEWVPDIDTWVSLAVILSSLTVSVVWSLVKTSSKRRR